MSLKYFIIIFIILTRTSLLRIFRIILRVPWIFYFIHLNLLQRHKNPRCNKILNAKNRGYSIVYRYENLTFFIQRYKFPKSKVENRSYLNCILRTVYSTLPPDLRPDHASFSRMLRHILFIIPRRSSQALHRSMQTQPTILVHAY